MTNAKRTVMSAEEDAKVEAAALEFAKANKKAIAKKLTDLNVYPAEADPVSVFMAGSPGAGKTESSLGLLKQFKNPIIRIDADALRAECPGYNGANAWLFQRATATLVSRIHDMALDQKQSFLLDGTFSNYERSYENIERSLSRKRTVQILFVYQEPHLAWQFVQAREAAEGRRIPGDRFIAQYFDSREAVNRVKKAFGAAVRVDLLLKNIDNSTRTYHANVDLIDHHIPEKYSRAEVEKIVKEA